VCNGYATAQWSSDHKRANVLILDAGAVASKRDGHDFGYVQSAEPVENGVHAW